LSSSLPTGCYERNRWWRAIGAFGALEWREFVDFDTEIRA
jgi:hypothetical protein